MSSEACGDAFNRNLLAKLQLFNQINKDIDRLEKRISTLRGQRSEIEQQIAIARASIAPINKIPNEILSLIFLYVTKPIFYNGEGLKSTYRDRASLLLVCKCWRDVVVKDPHLWSGILVTEPRGISTSEQVDWVERATTYLGMCLSRSKSVSLDVVIDLSKLTQGYRYVGDIIEREFQYLDVDGGVDELVDRWDTSPLIDAYNDLVPEVLHFLVEQQERWSSLYLELNQESEWAPPIFSILNHRCRNLRHLHLRGPFANEDLSEIPSLLRSTPELKLELELPWDVTLSTVPHLAKLSTLILIIPTKFDWKSLKQIQNFPQLKNLTIEVGIGELNVPRVDTIALPDLDHLHLVGGFPRAIFQAFECQQLSKLTINDGLFGSLFFMTAKLLTHVRTLVFLGPRYQSETFAQNALLDMLSQLEAVHTIQILHPLIKNTLEMVAIVRKKGHLRNLRTILARDEKSGLRDEIYSLPIDA